MFDLVDGSPLPARSALDFLRDGVSLDYEALRARLRDFRDESGSYIPFVPRRTPESIAELIARLELGQALLLVDERLPVAEQRSLARRIASHRPEPDDRVVLATSGSTGTPKLVVHTRASLLAAARASEANLGWGPEGDRWYLNLPLSHIGGLALLVRCIRARQTVVVGAARSSDPASVAEELRAGRVTLVSFVPTQLTRLVRSGFRAEQLRLRAALIGGAPVSPSLRAEARANGWPVLTTYGLTEMSSQVATERPSSLGAARLPLPGHVGPPIPGVSVRIGPEGTIEVRGPMALRAYLGEPSPLSTDGYFRTSDIGSIEPDGSLLVHGRKDNVLITGGENVSPELVEAAIAEIAGVRECCVSAVSDADWGQRLVGVIATETSTPLVVEEIQQILRDRLPLYAIPKEYRFVSDLPLLGSGKVDRRRVGSLLHPSNESASHNPRAP